MPELAEGSWCHQRPAAEVKVRWAGDGRVLKPVTDEPRHRSPSHSRGGVGDDSQERKAEDRKRGREGSQTHPGIGQTSGFTACLPKALTEEAFSRTSTASSHTPDTWELNLSGWKPLMVKSAQWQRSLRTNWARLEQLL